MLQQKAHYSQKYLYEMVVYQKLLLYHPESYHDFNHKSHFITSSKVILKWNRYPKYEIFKL